MLIQRCVSTLSGESDRDHVNAIVPHMAVHVTDSVCLVDCLCENIWKLQQSAKF